MAGKIDARLAELGIDLPQAAAPLANYVPATQSGGLLVISGQLCLRDGKCLHTGKLGREVTLVQGQEAARLCGLNILAQAKRALGGDLDRIRQCLRLGVFVSSSPDFTQQPAVANGCSDLMVEVFGDAGRHARAAVGVAALPADAAVEIEALFAVD